MNTPDLQEGQSYGSRRVAGGGGACSHTICTWVGNPASVLNNPKPPPPPPITAQDTGGTRNRRLWAAARQDLTSPDFCSKPSDTRGDRNF